MPEQISIGQVKRDISQLVNRVAFRGERIILTSRGKPKAALVSMEDYAKLQSQQPSRHARRLAWLEQAKAQADEILRQNAGKWIDVDQLLDESRKELEERGGWLTDRR